MVRTGERLEMTSRTLIESLIVVSVAFGTIGLAADRLDQPCRLVEFGQLSFPESLAGDRVLPLQPVDVVAVAPRRRCNRLSGITLQHLAQQPRVAPAIHQDVVVGIDQVMTTFGDPHHDQAQQRRMIQLEALLALSIGQKLKRLLQLGLATPVVLPEG
ncbi:hypothetical protein D9M70_558990 [compost metagenome]